MNANNSHTSNLINRTWKRLSNQSGLWCSWSELVVGLTMTTMIVLSIVSISCESENKTNHSGKSSDFSTIGVHNWSSGAVLTILDNKNDNEYLMITNYNGVPIQIIPRLPKREEKGE